MATLDTTTAAEYAAEVNAADRAQVIIDALTAPVYGRVYDSEDNVMGEGTMSSPWATVSGEAVIPTTLNGFYVASLGSVNDGWYFKFESGSRYVRCSFGLVGSGKEAEWSLSTWDVGTQAGIINGAITVSGNTAPQFTAAPTTASIVSGGGTIQFTAVDPQDDTVTYSLPTTRTGITVNALTGLVTVASSAAGTSGNIVVRASDGILTTDHTCSVVVADSSTTLIRFAPGFYIEPGLGDTADSIVAKLNSYDSRIKGVFLRRYWRYLETSKSVFDWAFLDTVHDACESTGRKLVVRVQTRSFGSTDPGSTCPSYLQSEGLTYTLPSRNRSGAALWRSNCTNYLINLYERIADRYGDSNTLVGMGNEETTLGMTPAESGDYTASGFINQLIRTLQEVRSYAPQLGWWIYPNGLNFDNSTFDTLRTLHAAGRADLGVVFSGGPDLNTLDPSGRGAGINILTGAIGGIDHKDDYMVIAQTESDDWADGATAAQLYADMSTFFRANYMVWSTNPAEWTAEAYPYLNGRTANTDTPALLSGLVEIL